MSEINWKEIAPKRADWERINEGCAEQGIPLPRWVNGIPLGLNEKQLVILREIAVGRARPPRHKRKK